MATLSVFAAVDVPPLLFNLVFGESVLNDAVAIVLFRTLVRQALWLNLRGFYDKWNISSKNDKMICMLGA